MKLCEEEILKIVGDYLGTPVFRLNLETNLVKDLKIHSVDLRELIITVEEQFGIKIPVNKMTHIERIQDLVKTVEDVLEELKDDRA